MNKRHYQLIAAAFKAARDAQLTDDGRSAVDRAICEVAHVLKGEDSTFNYHDFYAGCGLVCDCEGGG